MLTNSNNYLKEEYLMEIDLVDYMIRVIKSQQKKMIRFLSRILDPNGHLTLDTDYTTKEINHHLNH